MLPLQTAPRPGGRAAALLLAGLLAAAPPASAQSDEEAVLQTTQALFEALAARDTAAYRALVEPEARTIRVLSQGDSAQIRWGDNDDFVRSLARVGPSFLERMWQAEVRISGPIATIWTPYDFHLGGEFSHCGIDAFQLVRTDQGWKIASIMYTVIQSQDQCGDSPLGPPGT
jgi:hypothetical protein